MDAREVALLTLNACERQGGWSDGVLKKQIAAAGLDSRDAGLATQLCFGVIQNRILLDFYLSKFSNIPLRRLEGKVLQALRLGLYQMLFLTRIPHSAAVDQSVALTRAHCKNPRAPGMVNAILRNLERSLDRLPTIPEDDPAEYYATLYSHPVWLVRELLETLGSEGTAAFLQADNSQPPITAMVNTVKTDLEGALEALQAEGVHGEPHPWLKNCLVLSRSGSLEELDVFQNGLFYVQDPASRLAVMALDPEPGSRVLDMCAAPGGKSFAAAIQMKDQGEIWSCDLPSSRRGPSAWASPASAPRPPTARCAARSGRGPLTGCWWTPPAPAWGSSGRSRTSASRTRSRFRGCPRCRAPFWTTPPAM